MALLKENEIHDLLNALVSSGLDLAEERRAFIQGIDPHYVGVLPKMGSSIGQIMTDVSQMNQVERLTTGQIPLEIYLRNASFFLKNRPEEEIIRAALDNITHKASGAPRVVPQQPDILQQVIHRDDTVSFAFMEAGLKAATSTIKLKITSYLNGQPRTMQGGQKMMFQGTGWLISKGLVVTNHHVINARREGEAKASNNDLKVQVANMIGQFDYDAEGIVPVDVNFVSLEAWNLDLDYAVVRLQNATQRQELLLNKQAIVVGTDPVPVNIVQHPNGMPKRYGIRNNLMHFANNVELRYFTDTDNGSSGAAVMDDKWTVVGLHRGSSFLRNVQFQGKPTAYVNIGTAITAVINDIKTQHVPLATELGL